MIITIGIEKGGTGKSTMATNIATFQASKNKEVVILDSDIQGTSSDWMAVREEIKENLPSIDVFIQRNDIDKLVRRLSKKYDDVIIDVGGQAGRSLGSALLCSDKIYMPVRPSQADLWTLDKMNHLIDNAKGVNPSLKAYVFINQAPTNPIVKETELAKNYISNFEHIVLSECIIRERKIFRDALLEGKSVLEYKNSKASQEMLSLCNEIFEE